MKIAVAGLGYVGLSLAVLLSQRHEVTAADIDPEKVNMVNRRRSPVRDPQIERFFAEKGLRLRAVTDVGEACRGARFVIIATPTDYREGREGLDTSSVEETAALVLEQEPDAVPVIKSTVPVGFTERFCTEHHTNRILFSPEFLREGHALEEHLYPSRIIVGTVREDERMRKEAEAFAGLLAEGALRDAPALFMSASEAESVKLFANTYLALRVSFFNELDTYAQMRGLDTRRIIDGVCLDPRIGQGYNNPSFGYGGYCLPKDTKQLLADCRDVPENLISAIVEANRTRKDFIAGQVAGPGIAVGVYRLTMKTDSDNFRHSSVRGVMERLRELGVRMVVYEPALRETVFEGCRVIRSLEEFIAASDVILANRFAPELESCREKVYTRDIYGRD